VSVVLKTKLILGFGGVVESTGLRAALNRSAGK
jgi:hypothetical protein